MEETILSLYKEMMNAPHLVILGAGATVAAIPNGDKHGKKSPTMKGFFETTGLKELYEEIKLESKEDDLEAVYSELYSLPQYISLLKKLENGIVDYFKTMQLPDYMTVYDYLVVALTGKDCIASFNWDPLLIQAYDRISKKITNNLPELLFLHGNVNIGLCNDCKRYRPLQNKYCDKCGKQLIMPKLLYPVKEKDYNTDMFIKDQWDKFKRYISKSGLVTFFGYSFPLSDEAAREAIISIYSSKFRKLEIIEVIDINKDDKSFQDNWNDFYKPTNGHIKFVKSFWDSIIAEYPRRTSQGYTKWAMGCWNGSDLSLQEQRSILELRRLISPLLKEEIKRLTPKL